MTPNLEEGIHRMFGKHEPKRRERIKAMFMRQFTQRTVEDIIREEIGDVEENATLRPRLRPFILHK